MPAVDAVDLVIVVARSIVLVIVAIGGVLSIYLGWKLYRDGLISPTHAEFENDQKWKFRLTALGPGVFFALFGMGILIYLVRQDVVISDTVPVSVTESGFERAAPHPALELLSASVLQSTPEAAFSQITYQNRRYRCALAVRYRRLSSGGYLTPEMIRSGAASAIKFLDRVDTRGLSPSEAAELRDTRQVMQDILEDARDGA